MSGNSVCPPVAAAIVRAQLAVRASDRWPERAVTQISLIPHDGKTRAVHTLDEFDVYAGRNGGRDPRLVPIGSSGWLGNPHAVTETCRVCHVWHRAPSDALTAFEFGYFLPRLATDHAFRAAILALRGKRLGCPGCPTGAPCHARVIAEWIEANP